MNAEQLRAELVEVLAAATGSTASRYFAMAAAHAGHAPQAA